MSLCYDFQKWMIVSLASIAISLTIGLVLVAHGQGINMSISVQPNNTSSMVDKLAQAKEKYQEGQVQEENEQNDAYVTVLCGEPDVMLKLIKTFDPTANKTSVDAFCSAWNSMPKFNMTELNEEIKK